MIDFWRFLNFWPNVELRIFLSPFSILSSPANMRSNNPNFADIKLSKDARRGPRFWFPDLDALKSGFSFFIQIWSI